MDWMDCWVMDGWVGLTDGGWGLWIGLTLDGVFFMDDGSRAALF